MTTTLRSTFLILTIAAAGMGALLAFLPAAGHDQLWCLYVARHVLDGTPLYGPELMESNPPLIIWLSMLPVALAQLLHIPAPAVGKTLVILLEAFIAAVCLRQLRRTVALNPTQLSALAFAFVTLFNVVPARDLGQRDDLLTLLCLPYLLAASLRNPGAPNPGGPSSTTVLPSSKVGSTDAFTSTLEQTLIGLAAGLGLALKPHQALLPIAVELYLVFRVRSLRPLLRPEPFALLAVAVAYFAAIHRLTPNYLTSILPVLRDTYWAVGSLTLPQLLWQAIELHILAALAIFLRLELGSRRRNNRPSKDAGCPMSGFSDMGFDRDANLSLIFLIAGAASTVAYYLQGTGWYYQQLPAITFFAFALVFELIPLFSKAPRTPAVPCSLFPVPSWTPIAAFALGFLALALTAHFMNYPFTAAHSFPIDTPDPAFFDHLAPSTPVATLTTTVDDTVMPAARYHLTIAQRYPHLWMLPAILRNEQPDPNHPPHHVIPPARLAQLDRLQHEFMTEDLSRWKPQLVLVERCQQATVHCQLLEDRHDDLLAWFLRDPAFAAQWRSYTYTGTRGDFDAYVRFATE